MFRHSIKDERAGCSKSCQLVRRCPTIMPSPMFRIDIVKAVALVDILLMLLTLLMVRRNSKPT